jgi:tRNA-Thr(GGU) m(6)t(6)A37 methyltransferase TsaA
MNLNLEPIGWVRSRQQLPEDDCWGATSALIELEQRFDENSLTGLDAFSHVEVIFAFHQVSAENIVTGARHPRNNPAWPQVGIFAQRGKNRPNRLGTTLVRVLEVSGRTLRVSELDAIDGTPVLDLKPVMQEFLPRAPVRQPPWATELMAKYWAPVG